MKLYVEYVILVYSFVCKVLMESGQQAVLQLEIVYFCNATVKGKISPNKDYFKPVIFKFKRLIRNINQQKISFFLYVRDRRKHAASLKEKKKKKKICTHTLKSPLSVCFQRMAEKMVKEKMVLGKNGPGKIGPCDLQNIRKN